MPVLDHQHDFANTNDGHGCMDCTAAVTNDDMNNNPGLTPIQVWERLHPTISVEVTTVEPEPAHDPEPKHTPFQHHKEPKEHKVVTVVDVPVQDPPAYDAWAANTDDKPATKPATNPDINRSTRPQRWDDTHKRWHD